MRASRLGVVVAAVWCAGSLVFGCNALFGIEGGQLSGGDDASPDVTTGDAGEHVGVPIEAGDVDADARPRDVTVGDAPETPDAPDAPPDAADGATCTVGLGCTPAACQLGTTACTDAGGQACVGVGNASDGLACDAGAVCSNGSCVGCAPGTDCSQTGSCQKMTIACATGTPTCVAAGNQPNGSSCGTNLYCNAGTCAACTAGAGCVPSGKPCDLGTVACSAGQIMCTDTGQAATDGTSCGLNQVCRGGQCSACTAGGSCAPANPCHTGVYSCASGTLQCVDQNINQPPGYSCGLNQVCDNGVCNGCTAGGTCTPANACHQGLGSCTSGAFQCVDQNTNQPNGLFCATGEVCDNGVCTGCAAGGTCPLVAPDNPCHVGVYSCASGTQACVDQTPPTNQPPGYSCGLNQVCDNGVCNGCTANMGCTPTNPCHAGLTSCTTGTQLCVDQGTNANDGTTCNGGPTACYKGACDCAFPGLQAYFPLNGDFLDYSGNGVGATGTRVFFQGGGPMGQQSLLFEQAPYGQVTLFGSYDYSFTGARSLCAWFSDELLANGAGYPVFAGGASGAGDTFAVQPESSPSNVDCGGINTPFIDHWGSSCVTSSVTVNPGAMSFVCYAFSGSTNENVFYANGNSWTSATSLYTWNLLSLGIGFNSINSSKVEPAMNGSMAEVSIWSVALSAGQLQALWNGGNGCKVH